MNTGLQLILSGLLFIGIPIVIVLIILVIVSYIEYRREKKKKDIKRQEIAEQNMRLEDELQQGIILLKQETERLQSNVTSLKDKALDLQNECTHWLEITESARESTNKQREDLQERLEESKKLLAEKYQDYIEECNDTYREVLKDNMEEYTVYTQSLQDDLASYETKLLDLKSKTDAAIAANIRANEEEEKKDFYKLQLSELDLLEIEELRDVIPKLRNPEPLNKVIWKTYYEHPYSDLIGRVLGKGTITGIYKITNLHNQKCYVGQAVNVAERWKQHIKRGLGAETTTRNKLYPAMMKDGVENFSFELVEECTRDKLNEQEDYWQDYFQAKEFGYSIK